MDKHSITIINQAQKAPNSPYEAQMKSTNCFSQFDWKLNQFDEETALKHFSKLGNIELPSDHPPNQHNILSVVDSNEKMSGLVKHTTYIIRGQDPIGNKIEIVRKYNDFLALREVLVKRWLGCIIPPIPDKSLTVGVTEEQIKRNRIKFLNNFLKRISQNEALYQGEQMELFLKGDQNSIEKSLEKFKPLKPEEVLKIYSEKFTQIFQQSEQLSEMQSKILSFESYFRDKKTDLNRIKSQLKRLALMKDNLAKTKHKVLEKLLPQYEETCLPWFQRTTTQEQPLQPVVSKVYGHEKYKGILGAYVDEIFTGEGTNSNWYLFQTFKFQLKQIDAVLQAITLYKLINNDRKFYIRNIQNNKQQLQDISNNVTTLKIFFLSGSTDEKRTQLLNETQHFEKELKVRQDLWRGTTQLLMREIHTFHQERIQTYKDGIGNSFRAQALYMGKLFNLYVDAQRL